MLSQSLPVLSDGIAQGDFCFPALFVALACLRKGVFQEATEPAEKRFALSSGDLRGKAPLAGVGALSAKQDEAPGCFSGIEAAIRSSVVKAINRVLSSQSLNSVAA